MKAESLRTRGWATAIVGVLFLVIAMVASLANSQTLGGFVATGGDYWLMTFWVLAGITGATLTIAGILIVAVGYLEETRRS